MSKKKETEDNMGGIMLEICILRPWEAFGITLSFWFPTQRKHEKYRKVYYLQQYTYWGKLM